MDDRSRVLAGVSRETGNKLQWLVDEVHRWQSVKNLVGPSTLPGIWDRHIADSLQLLRHETRAGAWIDLGSGGGFPGLVIAIQRSELGLGSTHLVESDRRKTAFLLHCARGLGINAAIHPQRINPAHLASIPDVVAVSARALAPITQLLMWTTGLLRNGATGIFPKGQDVDIELQHAAKSCDFRAVLNPSETDPAGRIVVIRMGSSEEAPSCPPTP
jgi:16S rRNA (guanine527-N7)-methyltransferase